MSSHARYERLLGAVYPKQENYEQAGNLIADLDPEQRRHLLSVLCEHRYDARRAAFMQTVITAFPDVVHAVGAFGETALHVAAYWTDFQLMRLLIDNGADVDKRTPKAWYYAHNDAKLPKGSSPRSLFARGVKFTLDFWAPSPAKLQEELEQLRNTLAVTHVDGIPLVLGITFEAWWAEQVRPPEAKPPRKAATKTRKAPPA